MSGVSQLLTVGVSRLLTPPPPFQFSPPSLATPTNDNEDRLKRWAQARLGLNSNQLEACPILALAYAWLFAPAIMSWTAPEEDWRQQRGHWKSPILGLMALLGAAADPEAIAGCDSGGGLSTYAETQLPINDSFLLSLVTNCG